MRRNILKIPNLGPKMWTQMEAKSHGFVKHFKQVYVTLAGIMRVMANGKDIFVQHVWIKVRLSIILKRIVTGPRSQKLAQGSSCHSHDPSSKSSESYPSDCETGVVVCKKFLSRYVYSAHCNPTAFESLLAMSKHKAFRVFCCKVKSIPSGYPYSGGTIVNALKPCGNRVVTAKRSYPRSYAQVVKKSLQSRLQNQR